MSDNHDVGIGARLLAIEVALRALIEHASSTDPAVRDRIKTAAEVYFQTIPSPSSEPERKFIDRAKACIASIVRPPG